LDSSIGIHYFDYKDNPEKLKKYIGTVVSSLLIIGVAVTLISILFGDLIFSLIFRKHTMVYWPFGLMCILTAIFTSFYKTYSNLLINQQRTTRFFWINILFFFASIIFTYLGILWFPKVIDGPLWGRLIPSIILFVITFYFFAKEYGIKFHSEFIPEMVKFCLPLLYYAIIMWGASYGDRFIINYLLTPFDVGIYDFGMKWVMLIDVVLLALTNTINPAIFRIWTDKKINYSTPEVNQNHHFFTLSQMLLIAGVLLFVPLVVPLFVHNTMYYKSFEYLPILALGFLFRGVSNMYLMPIFYYKKTKVLPKIFFLSSIFQFILTFIFIHFLGIIGAAISFVIAKPIQIWLIAIESKKVFSFDYNKTKMIFLPVIYGLVILVIYYLIGDYLKLWIKNILQAFVCLSMILLLYRKEIKEKIFKKTIQE
jgi:O-antigen/teichoic acid export membrane protein